MNWKTVCLPKDQGGLGVLDIGLMNIALLAKLLWKLINEKGMWQIVFLKKYLTNSSLGQCVMKPGDSHFWQRLMEIKPLFLACCRFEVGNGRRTRFWEDLWFSDTCFAVRFPLFFGVLNDQNVLVSTVFSAGVNSLSFRRNLSAEKMVEWRELLRICSGVRLTEEEDKFV